MRQTDRYRIRFQPEVPLDAVEDTLVVAAIAVESLMGRAAFKLDATYHLDRDERLVVVDGSTAAGQHIARVLVGLMAREFGEGSFTVERDVGAAAAAGGER